MDGPAQSSTGQVREKTGIGRMHVLEKIGSRL